MDIQEARQKAQAFIEQRNQSISATDEYRLVPVQASKDLGSVWYFDFRIERTDGKPMGPEDAHAGAPGYVVSKLTGKVEGIGWGTLRELEKNLVRFKELDGILESAKDQPLDLTRLRAATGLLPTVLLSLRNKYQELDMGHEHNRIALIQEIQNSLQGHPQSRG